ncbi:MAG: ketoacyl-ACP synthase III [Blastocatellia bacterium]|nr:ketoacyl-ACP synthase III [Blastocatellia bacterium]
MPFVKIAGTGSYVPERVVTNAELSERLGENINDFVANVVGINERHVCGDNESTADLATNAALRALSAAKVKPEEIDLIILATDTPEYLSPATSVVVQYRLGAARAGTFDINCACAGFVTALETASKFILADSNYRNVLVIGAYAMTKFLDWNDKKTCTIFADGAGAVVLQASATGPGILASKLVANGAYHDHMGIFAGGTHLPITHEVLAENNFTKVRFAKKYPPEVNLEGWPSIIHDVLAKAGLQVEGVDFFLFTQVNLSTIKEVMRRMEIPAEKTHTIMGKWGYTGSACIPMVLDDALAAGKIKPGDKVIFCASGGGLNMACLLYQF